MASPPSSLPSDFSELSDQDDPDEGVHPHPDEGVHPDKGVHPHPDEGVHPDEGDLDDEGTGTHSSAPALQFWYVDHEGHSVLNKDSASVTFNGGFGLVGVVTS